jgi:hypothetical protein
MNGSMSGVQLAIDNIYPCVELSHIINVDSSSMSAMRERAGGWVCGMQQS